MAYMNGLVRLERERNIRPDAEIDAFMKSLQLRCVYACSVCCPETCDHVYLFDNDYDDSKDIYRKSMRCRFPYDQRCRLILEPFKPWKAINMPCCKQAHKKAFAR
ncbi:hypothetical protein ACFX2I_020170 [Malus domestica]